MRKNKGFSLPEVMIAVFVLSVFIATVTPIYIKVNSERLAMIEQDVALGELLNRLNLWAVTGIYEPETITISGTDYHIKWSTVGDDQRMKGCISWESVNGRNYETCGYAASFETY